MNRTRRRHAHARRRRARIIRDLREWTRTHDVDTELPQRGRLRLPVMRLRTWFRFHYGWPSVQSLLLDPYASLRAVLDHFAPRGEALHDASVRAAMAAQPTDAAKGGGT